MKIKLTISCRINQQVLLKQRKYLFLLSSRSYYKICIWKIEKHEFEIDLKIEKEAKEIT